MLQALIGLMLSEIDKLEAIPDGEVSVLKFKGGDSLELFNYEEVDETIYNKRGVLLAQVKWKLIGDKRFHTPGTFIEFELEHVESIKELNGAVIYEAAN